MNFIQKFKSNKNQQNLVNFVKEGLESFGLDYNKTKQRIITINDFFDVVKKLEKNGTRINGSFCHLLDAYTYFFDPKYPISDIVYSNENYSAKFKLPKYDKTTQDYDFKKTSTQGVAITKEFTNSPMMYFGSRCNVVEYIKDDTALIFDEYNVRYHHGDKAYFDEIPLWGTGARASFLFDDNNNMIEATIQYMDEPRLGFWADPICYHFEGGYFDKERELATASDPTNPLLSESNNPRLQESNNPDL